MKKKLKKIIILITIISISLLLLSKISFAKIEFGITDDDIPTLVGTTEKSDEAEEMSKYHHDNLYYIMKDDDDDVKNKTTMSKQEALAKLNYLDKNCTCSTFIHIKHEGCSATGGWKAGDRDDPGWRKCDQYQIWDDLFAVLDSWIGSQDLSTYTKSQLITKLKTWINNLDDKMTITQLMEFLNDKHYDLMQKDSTGYYMLRTNSSLFCLKHGQAIGRYHQWLIKDHDTNCADLSTKITTTGDTFDTYTVAEGGWTDLTYEESFDYMDKKTENETTRIVKSNVKYFCNDFQNIYEISNGFGTYTTNVFAYAAAYAELKSDTVSYLEERAQLGIWGVVGNPGKGDPVVLDEDDAETVEIENVDDDDETTIENTDSIKDAELYEAGAALDEYEKWLTRDVSGSDLQKHNIAIKGTDPDLRNDPEVFILGDRGAVTSGTNVGEYDAEPTGTTIFEGNGVDGTTAGTIYYRIGPFHMADYAYAEANSDIIEKYSGSELSEYKKLLGGIISGKVRFSDQYGNQTAELTVGDGAGEAKIVYTDPLGNTTDTGAKGMTLGKYVHTPTNYDFPHPDSIFYIVVDVNDCGDTASVLTDISFEYRQTKADGHGWVIQSKYIQTTFTRTAKVPDTGDYYCTGAGGSGCYNDEIPFDERTESDVEGDPKEHTYYCREYEYGTKYCKYGYKKGSSNYGDNCSTKKICDDDECDHDDDCYVHNCSSRKYCQHGYQYGRHDESYDSEYWEGTIDDTNTTCSHTTRCNDHKDNIYAKAADDNGHENCYTTNWEKTDIGPMAGQPFLAVHDAYVKVIKRKITTTLNIRLTVDVTIDKYIYNVEHSKENTDLSHSVAYTTHDDTYDSDNFTNSTARQLKSDSEKKVSTVKVERGDIITYRIVLDNKDNNIGVKVQVKDVIPEYCEFKSLSVGTFYPPTEDSETASENKARCNKITAQGFFITEWITIPANEEEIITVDVIATASDAEIENKNTATLVSGNAGRDIADKDTNIPTANDAKINYMRVTDNPVSGAVVNLAQVSRDSNNKLTTPLDNVLESSDYYTVKSYSVVLDKYITKVEHTTTKEVTYERYAGAKNINDDSWVTTNTNYTDRDKYNHDSSKKDEPIVVEYGDRVTYDIDIQNTWSANNYEMQQNKNSANDTIMSHPYYAPNYIHVDITDTLPDCYEEGSLKVEYIIYETGYGNNLEGKNSTTNTPGETNYIEETIPLDPEVNDKVFTVPNLYINPNSEATLRVSYIVNTNKVGTLFENNVYLNEDSDKGSCGGSDYGNELRYEIRNINNYYVYNVTNKETNGVKAPLRVDTSDYFILNDYNVDIETYITDYREEMLTQNTQSSYEVEADNFSVEGLETWDGTTSDKSKTRRRVEGSVSGMNDEKKAGNPVQVEKNETLQYTIRLYNNSIAETATDSTKTQIQGDSILPNLTYYYKPATTVRTSSIKVTLDDGLALYTGSNDSIKVKATIYPSIDKADSKTDGEAVDVTISPDSAYNVFYFNIANKYSSTKEGSDLDKDYTLLQPGSVIEYTMDVQVVKSNMYLENIENNAQIHILTDVNNEIDGSEDSATSNNTGDHTRVVTQRNLRNSPSIYDNVNNNTFTYPSSSDYVRLKDLIIAGKVWLDRDKDGYMGVRNNAQISGSITHGDSREIVYDDETSEKAMEGIVVKLYKAGETSPVAVTKTNSQGLYTFAKDENGAFKGGLSQRVPRASEKGYIDYYVEFEYDGVTYKSTEVYGGSNSVDNNWGQGNLEQNWIQTENRKYYHNDYLLTITQTKPTFAKIAYLKYNNLESDIDNKDKLNDNKLQELYENENYKYDSNAYEFTDVREEFNKNYQTVTYNYAYATDAAGKASTSNGGAELEYTKDGHTSYLNIDHERVMKARSFIKRNSNESLDNTDELWLYYNKYTNAHTADGSNYLPETEYLKYINLGLEEREDIDISLTKDVYEVKTTINGEEMTYSYDQNEGVNGQMEKDGYLQNYEVGKPYGLTLYESDFKYRAEQYENQAVKDYKGEESELNIEVTYRIRIDSTAFENDDPFMADAYKDKKLDTTVHEIVDLYDENFVKYNDNPYEYIRLREKDEDNIFKEEDKKIKIAEAWCYDNGGNKVELTLSNSSKYLDATAHATKDNDFTTSDGTNTGYNTLYITGMDTPHTKIEEGGHLDIYVKYVVDKDEKVDTREETIDGNTATVHTLKGELKIGNDDDLVKEHKETENIAQINAYSIWYEKDGKPTSIVDTDSNAGNVGIDNSGNRIEDKAEDADKIDYYEDTVYKTEINITSPNSPNEPENVGEGGELSATNPIIPIRTVTGKVWDDARTKEEAKTQEANINAGDGTVTTDTMTYTNYLGDGLYDTDDTKKPGAMLNENVEANYKDGGLTEEKDIEVRNAKVEYVEVVAMRSDSDADGDGKKDLIYYEEKLDKKPDGTPLPWNPVQEDRTEDDGTYKLTGLIPGYYIVRYTYGDSIIDDLVYDPTSEAQKDMLIFNGQDYKSTKYTGTSDVATEAEKTDKNLREDRIVKEMEEKDKSDAKDDEIKRLETIAYSETMVSQKAEILKGLANGSVTSDDPNTTEQLKSLTDNTYMYADTVQFYVKPEKLETTTNPDKLDIREAYKACISDGIAYSKIMDLEFEDTFVSSRTFNIKNLDFGIEYRPESQITLNKEVSAISLITSDGEELVRLALRTKNFGEGSNQEHEIIEEESIGLEYTQFISSDYTTINPYALTSEDYQGFIFINVEDDILQGSTIEIDYKFVAENNSEVDFVSKYLNTLRYRENITGTLYGTYENFFAFSNLNETVGEYSELYLGSMINADSGNKFVYTAAGTARNLLYQEYYDKDVHGSTYRKKELKTYDVTKDETGVQKKSDAEQAADIYYGRYLSKFYYLGEVGTEDVIASLKFDKILDYVDTDLVFRENSAKKEKNTLWSTSTDNELKRIFVHERNFIDMPTPISGILGTSNEIIDKNLINSKGISYVTYQKDADNNVRPVTSNLVVSVDDRVTDLNDDNINESLSRYLLPYLEEAREGGMKLTNAPDSRGNIVLTVSKVISAESADTEDLQYENIAEVIQFTTQTGRRTNYTTTIGNAAVRTGEFLAATTESDTTATEVITLTPPTGLDRLNRVVRDTVETAGMGIGITVVAVALVIGGFVIVRFTIKKIKKRRIK